MRYGSVCSGIEAATVAWRSLGWHCAFVSEIEPFASEVLKRRLPQVPNLGDFTKIRGTGNGEREMGKEVADYDGDIDLLVGGTPCQSYSYAGLRGGIADPRGNLALEFVRLAERTDARWVVWENVVGVLTSGGGRDFAAFLSELAGWDVEVPDGGWRNAGIVTNAPGRFGVSWSWTRDIPEFPHFRGRCRTEGAVSSLSDVVAPGRAPQKYCLAASYAEAMLARAERLGYSLPSVLEAVLRASVSR